MRSHKQDRITTLVLFINFILVIVSFDLLRPVRSSLVLSNLGSGAFPYLWLGTSFSCVVFVFLYSKLLEIFKRINVLRFSILIFCIILFIFRYLYDHYPKAISGLFYIWGDVYVIVIIEQLWSLAVDHFPENNAKKYFGFMNAGSILGGVIGSFIVSLTVNKIGTLSLIYIICFTCLLQFYTAGLVFSELRKDIANKLKPKTNEGIGFFSGIKLVSKHHYLLLLLFSVFFTQMISNLIDFEFNHFFENYTQNLDLRTYLIGRFYTWLNSFALVLSLCMPFFYKYLGALKSFFVLPFSNLIMMALTAIFPNPFQLLFLKGLDKSFNYSIDRLSKEMFYIPVSTDIKYKAKSFIDMFVYRFGSAGGALFLLAFKDKINILHAVIAITFALIAIRIGIVKIIRTTKN